MELITYFTPNGKRADYVNYGKAVPPYPKSEYIVEAVFDKRRYHSAVGDMWPLTWAADDNIYGGAGDNRKSPMNFWRISGEPDFYGVNQNEWIVDLVNNLPIEPIHYCKDPNVHRSKGLKPASLLDVDGTMFFAVENQNYGSDPTFTRQKNTNGWIIVSRDFGKTWIKDATPTDFFTGRLASCHFLQFGKGYKGARDSYAYAYFPAADDGNSYWENGDYMLLGRVYCSQFDNLHILNREEWEFYTGMKDGNPVWSTDDNLAVPVFRYNKMTGENHVSYNSAIGRYILGNYGHVDDEIRPRPNHQGEWPHCAYRSQLTLYEAPEPWGPWSLFYQDDDWGTYGDYQPSFPTKWMSPDGKVMFMVSSGTYDDYNFTVQRLNIKLKGDK